LRNFINFIILHFLQPFFSTNIKSTLSGYCMNYKILYSLPCTRNWQTTQAYK